MRLLIKAVFLSNLIIGPVTAQTTNQLPIGANNCAIALALNIKLPAECVNPPLGQKRGIVIRLDNEIRTQPKVRSGAVANKPSISKVSKPKNTQTNHQAVKSDGGYFIHFALNSFDLEPDYKEHLQRLAAVLSSGAMATSCLRVTGHTDTSGDANYNLALSKKRAVMVATYLAEYGKVDPTRVQISAKGETLPLPDIIGTDPHNRRVEFSTKDSNAGCT